jgi:hypothetical protein
MVVAAPLRHVREARQLPGQACPRRLRARARGRPVAAEALGRRQDLHLHHPQGLPLLAALERAGDGADVQVHDRAEPQPKDERARALQWLPRRRRRRKRLHDGENAPHRGSRRAREHADDPTRLAGSRPRHPAHDALLLCRPDRHPDRPERPSHDPDGGAILHRLLHARPGGRARAKSELRRQPSAPARPGRADVRRLEAEDRSPDRGRHRRLRDRRRGFGRCRQARCSLRAWQRGGEEREAEVLRQLAPGLRLPHAEHPSAAVPRRAGPAGGQLCDRSPRPGQPRQPVLIRIAPLRSVPAAGDIRLQGRRHLPVCPGCRHGAAAGGREAENRGLLHLQSVALRPDGAGREERPRGKSGSTCR